MKTATGRLEGNDLVWTGTPGTGNTIKIKMVFEGRHTTPARSDGL